MVVVLVAGSIRGGPKAAVGEAAPPIAGTTLDGAAFDLASLRGHPAVVNFWGPSCVPCRDEFPLLEGKLAEHAADGLEIVGVLTDDPVVPAREFVARVRRHVADRRRSGQVAQDRPIASPGDRRPTSWTGPA